ncbi:MAG: AMP-binding protein, partial [Lutibacter sp.]
MNNNNIGTEIRNRVLQYQAKNAIYYKDHKLKTWVGISWTDFGDKIQKLSKALLNFGIKEHQNVAIFAENMPDWIIADIAIMSIRAVTVPIYATNSRKEVEYIVNDAEINLIFVGCQEEYNKAFEISKTNNYLKLIVTLCEDIKFENTENSIHLNDFLVFKTNETIETELQKRYYESESTDLASIIYTSGTTGEPKGVMLDHTNFTESLKAHDFELNVSENDTSLSFLPLSHIYERSWVFFCLHRGIKVYFNQNPKLIVEVLKEVKPTLMCTVPRIFEKIFAAIQDKRKEASPTSMKVASWALGIGNAYY